MLYYTICFENIAPVKVQIVHGYDCVETPDGEVGFSCYLPEENTIIVPDDLPQDIFLSCIAHEIYHHIEHCFGLDYNEEKAEAFADEVMALWDIEKGENINGN